MENIIFPLNLPEMQFKFDVIFKNTSTSSYATYKANFFQGQ
jgi:hypothetical protein